ncbi:REP-associated tyrosine transposase [Marinoscillum pacificum]|uniref:REP-associated tyrosine transposase n=1 Tax=Marinoscillum pacificum TaxID=392723 RepID=UPI00215768A8|nr:transposase [Marinoscillum pacificum]
MSELRKANTDHAYFLTFTIVGWIDLFTRKECCDIVIDSLQYCQKNKNLEIYAYVIMPSHIHMVARRTEGLMSDLIRDFKSHTAKQLLTIVHNSNVESRSEWLLHMFRFHAKFKKQNKEFQVWQKTSHPTELFSNHIIDQKINYVEMNPVMAKIVTSPESYVYSSANPESIIEVIQA